MHVVATAQDRSWHKAEDLLRRSDSFRFLRSFCRVNEATAMPLDDPERAFRNRPPQPLATVSICRSGGSSTGCAAWGPTPCKALNQTVNAFEFADVGPELLGTRSDQYCGSIGER